VLLILASLPLASTKC